MRTVVFSAKTYDREFLKAANAHRHQLHFLEPRLTSETAPLALGHEAACLFVHDRADATAIRLLVNAGVRLLALRCAGFNNVDLHAAKAAGMAVVRVPAYSPYGVAEHAVGLVMELNRKFHRAFNRVRENNFSLEGLVGFDVHGKTVGVIGTGKIGECFANIMRGFGCRILAHDVHPNSKLVEAGVEYVELDSLFAQADIISLHCPLVESTHHLINEQSLKKMKKGVMIINTSRGALIDTKAVVHGIKNGTVGYLGLDVYEEEEGIFFENLSDRVITDDTLMRLLTFPNVIITSHQAFFTREALSNIAATTIENITLFEEKGETPHAVHPAA